VKSRARAVALAAVLLAVVHGGGRVASAARTGDGADDCGAPERLHGIDVSSYQGEIDWRRVHAAGIVFAFARISDGLDTVDERFAANFRRMRRAHVRRGAYQYFRASADAVAQADLAIRALRRAGGADLPLVLDIETDDGQPPDVVQAQVARWIARVERRTRRRAVVYTSPAHAALLGGAFAAQPLWIAHYEVDCPTVPEPWERWTLWQHSQTGRVDGIAGNVDLDEFAGTRRDLARLGRARKRD
jgi:lysozyme